MTRHNSNLPDLHTAMNGRLSFVLAGNELLAVKEAGKAWNCRFVDILYSVFCLVLEDAFPASGSKQFNLTPDSKAMEGLLRNVSRYQLQDEHDSAPHAAYLPRLDAERQELVPLPAPQALKGGAGFSYRRRWQGEEKVLPKSPGAADSGRLNYAAFDLVAEISEHQQHLLIECFFRPEKVPPHAAGRLLTLFAYRLQQLARLMRDQVAMSAMPSCA